MHWFADFLFLYALGISATVPLVPEQAIGRYFYRFHSILLMALAILASIVGRPLLTWSGAAPLGQVSQLAAAAFVLALFVSSAVVYISTAPLRKDLLWMPVSTGAIFAVFEAVQRSPDLASGLLLALHLLTSAAMLGSVLVAMILGHWYLQDATLSFDHLARLSRLFLGACIAKTAVSGLLIALDWARVAPLLDRFELVFIGTRVGAGLLMALVLAWMTLTCAKSKANQSATGILYVAVVFVIIGEAMSLHLTLQKGVAL